MKITKLYNEFQMQNTYFKIDLGCLRIQTWGDAGFQLHLYKMKPKAKAAHCVSRHTVHKFSDSWSYWEHSVMLCFARTMCNHAIHARNKSYPCMKNLRNKQIIRRFMTDYIKCRLFCTNDLNNKRKRLHGD